MTQGCSNAVCVFPQVYKGLRREGEAARGGDGGVFDDSVSDIYQEADGNEALGGLRAVVEFALGKVPGYVEGDGFALVTCEGLEFALYACAFGRAVNLFTDEIEECGRGFVNAEGDEEYCSGCRVVPVIVCELLDADVAEEARRACGDDGAGDQDYGCGIARFEGLDDFKERFHGVHGSTHGGGAQGGREVAV